VPVFYSLIAAQHAPEREIEVEAVETPDLATATA